MENKYMLISIDDEKSETLAKVLGSKTCKKIIDFLAENKEASQKDIADGLEFPLNTVEYNIKKLLESQIIEKTKNFFWSKKGKKIKMYALSNKSIIISPKNSNINSKLKSLLPVTMLALASTFVVYTYEKIKATSQVLSQSTKIATPQIANSFYETGLNDPIMETGIRTAVETNNFFFTSPSPIWIWFLAGALFAIGIFTLLNWKKL